MNAHPWFDFRARKHAGYMSSLSSLSGPTSFGVFDPMGAQALLNQHASPRYAKKVVLESPNVSLYDKGEFVQAINRVSRASPGGPGGSVKLRYLLPALAGAGLGYVGASLIAPALNLDPKNKRRLGIGAGALGAILNTAPMWWKGAAEAPQAPQPSQAPKLPQATWSPAEPKSRSLFARALSWAGDREVRRSLDRFQRTGEFAMSQNPIVSWVRTRYTRDPRNQKYIQSQLVSRLENPEFLERLWEHLRRV